MKITTEPRSDQWNAEDFIGGPQTFTIAGVKVGVAEQKYDIHLEGQERAWRPPLTVLRLLVAAWGDDATLWVGRRVTLYLDSTIRFGRDVVGGIRVSHLSHIDKAVTVNLAVSRGKRQAFTVQPLVESAPTPEPTERRASKAVDWFKAKGVEQSHLEARVGRPAAEWTDADLSELTANRDAIVTEATS